MQRMNELKGWLKNCGLNDKGWKSELSKHVQYGKESSSGQSIVVPRNYSVDDVSVVLNVIQCLSDMIRNFMVKQVDKEHM